MTQDELFSMGDSKGTPGNNMTGPYGPQTKQVEMLIKQSKIMTLEQAGKLSKAFKQNNNGLAIKLARKSAMDSAGFQYSDSLRRKAYYAACDSVWKKTRFSPLRLANNLSPLNFAYKAIYDVIFAVIVRDLIPKEDFALLSKIWRDVYGEIH